MLHKNILPLFWYARWSLIITTKWELDWSFLAINIVYKNCSKRYYIHFNQISLDFSGHLSSFKDSSSKSTRRCSGGVGTPKLFSWVVFISILQIIKILYLNHFIFSCKNFESYIDLRALELYYKCPFETHLHNLFFWSYDQLSLTLSHTQKQLVCTDYMIISFVYTAIHGQTNRNLLIWSGAAHIKLSRQKKSPRCKTCTSTTVHGRFTNTVGRVVPCVWNTIQSSMYPAGQAVTITGTLTLVYATDL
jgi:hypothetical protein